MVCKKVAVAAVAARAKLSSRFYQVSTVYINMFKRLKDKITEEVKISPSKFSASVQQWQQMAQV